MGKKVASIATEKKAMAKVIYAVKTDKKGIYKFKNNMMTYDEAVKFAKGYKI